MKGTKIKYVLPLLAFLGIVMVLALSLGSYKPKGVTGQDITGRKVDLKELVSVVDGKGIDATDPFILHVFASWCDACKGDMALLKNLRGMIKVYGLAWNDIPAAVSSFHLRTRVYDDVLNDPSGQVIFNLGVRSIPETFIIEKDGTIIYSYNGSLTDEIIKHGFFTKLNEIRRITPE